MVLIVSELHQKDTKPMPQQIEDKAAPEAALERMRHSAAHLMAAAVQQLWPGARFGVGPAVEHGFYYDIDVPVKLTDEDLPKIEAKMRELRNKKLPYERIELSVDDAIAEMEKRGQSFKVELLQLLKEKGSTAVAEETGDDDAVGTEESGGVTRVSFYKTGDFVDLCRGPHVDSSAQIGAFKLMSIAGAYWRGNEKNPQLQRLYGAAFESKEELEKYLFRIEEAKKRDHRRLGPQLDLFTFSELVGPGLPLFTPKGTLMRRLLEDFVQSLQEPLGYQRVSIPHITKNDLYKTSGHWDKFADDLFHVRGKSGDDFCIKPMNCPHHTQIYACRPRSYRDLPLRFSEVTAVYRDELPGVLSGLSRVRAITQDDAHVFCTPEQIAEEVGRIYAIIDGFYKVFDMELAVRLSLWDERHPDKYLGGPEVWNLSQGILRELLVARGVPFREEAGEAAFYGPKIDFTAVDALGRPWQLATIQLDYNLPARFDLTYTSSGGTKERPVMIHRAVLGSVERFMSVLIEHYAGAFPTWLAPVQAMIIPIAERHVEYARHLLERLRNANPNTLREAIRVELDDASEKMQKKIKFAQMAKVPYMLVVGDREAEQGEVAVRLRSGVDLKSMPVDQLVDRLRQEIATRQDLPAAPT
jgi:threonyl-tRNA synthetase